MHKLFTACVFIGLLTSCAPELRQSPPTPTAQPETEPKTERVLETAKNILPSPSSIIPFDSGWEYGTLVNWRPGDGIEASVNPPRFSWPYLPEIIAEDVLKIPPTVFQFQIADNASFENPIVDIKDTPYNFYNALAPLDPGTWYWRVGYGPQAETSWSKTRSFHVTADTPQWDRSLIAEAAEKLASIPHPRLGPANGDWAALNEQLKASPETAYRYQKLIEECDRVMALPYWNDFPESDDLGRPPKTREEKTRPVTTLKELTIVAYAYRLTGDPKYAGAIPRIIKMASWPRGGRLSPEGGLGGFTKMPSQAVEFFAVVYDWFADDFSEAQAATLKEAIRWRLHDMYFDPHSIIWQQGEETMRNYGLAYNGGSHPFQNYAWSLPAILLTAGDLEVSDELTELALHYLTGVTLQEGPEEGYNEGHGYSNEKAGTLLEAALVTHMLLPDLDVGKNPVIQNLVDWFTFMFSGPERLPWGDSWLGTARDVGGVNMRRLTVLTGSPLAKHLWIERGDGEYSANVRSLYNRPWYDFAVWDRYRNEIDAVPNTPEIGSTLFLKRAGWVFDHTRPILDLEDYNQAVGMQMQFRPMGGYGHSFSSDGSFVWFGYGSLLSSGGGWRSWASTSYSRNALSHNSILVNGSGHTQTDRYQPKRPYAARPLAYAEGEDFRYWAAELAPGFKPETGVQKWNRHVVRVRDVYLVYDDLAADQPATFTWLFHIPHEIPLELVEDGFSYTVDTTRANVVLQASGTFDLSNAVNILGAVNPVTGEDLYAPDNKRAASRGIFKKYVDAPIQHHNLRASTVTKTTDASFLAVLTCAPEGQELPTVSTGNAKQTELTFSDGTRITVSFDPEHPADITIDPTAF